MEELVEEFKQIVYQVNRDLFGEEAARLSVETDGITEEYLRQTVCELKKESPVHNEQINSLISELESVPTEDSTQIMLLELLKMFKD